MSEWQPIETAPKDKAFIALNHDGEIFPAKYIEDRLVYRLNSRREPRKFEIRMIDGERLLKEDEGYAMKNERWCSEWAYWSRLYEFEPTHWIPLPAPPPE